MAVFDDCIAYWKLDEASGQTRADADGSWDLADASGNVSAYSGKINNGALADSYNAAAGGTGTLYASTSPPAALSGSVFTLALWVKLPVSNSSSTMHSLLTLALSSSHTANIYYTPATGLFTWHLDDGINTYQKNVSSIDISSWRYMTFRWGAGSYYFTSDDPLSGGGSVGGTSNAVLASGLSLQRLTYRSDIVAIDEMGIWDAGLSAQDASDLYNSGAGLSHGDTTVTATPTTSLFGFHGFAT